MKFALASYGSRGDVEPLAAVGRELLRRGHDVRLAVPPSSLGLVESAGLAAVAFGSDPSGLADNNPTLTASQHPISLMPQVVGMFTQAWDEWSTALIELANGTDLLLTGKVEHGLAANVADYYRIPLATLHFFPEEDSRLSGLLGGIAKNAEDAQRRLLGLPEASGLATRGPLKIQAYDEFCFPGLAAQWAKQGVSGSSRPFVGALTLELPTDADDEVLSWIAAGTPPIYFGFGSNVRLPYPAETVAVIDAACAYLGERALICSGASDFTEVPHFDQVKVVSAVNHAAVFPVCRAVVHQGGVGTTAAGMRAGIPTLVLWFSLEDQPIWAEAVTQLKIGAGREFSASTLDSLVADLRFILAPECIARAREVAAQMTKPAESVTSAADLLEETASAGLFDG
jgi:UDP:flavonoid glycosyltransferase YjiC (YdhE family)